MNTRVFFAWSWREDELQKPREPCCSQSSGSCWILNPMLLRSAVNPLKARVAVCSSFCMSVSSVTTIREFCWKKKKTNPLQIEEKINNIENNCVCWTRSPKCNLPASGMLQFQCIYLVWSSYVLPEFTCTPRKINERIANMWPPGFGSPRLRYQYGNSWLLWEHLCMWKHENSVWEDTWSYFCTVAFSLPSEILTLLCSSSWGVKIPLPYRMPSLFFLDEDPQVHKKSVRVTQAGQDRADKCFCAACAATANSVNALGEHLPSWWGYWTWAKLS